MANVRSAPGDKFPGESRGGSDAGDEMPELFAEFVEHWKLDAYLEHYEREAQRRLKVIGISANWEKRLRGRRGRSTEPLRDAELMLDCLRAIRESRVQGDIDDAVIHAISLGVVANRTGIKSYEQRSESAEREVPQEKLNTQRGMSEALASGSRAQEKQVLSFAKRLLICGHRRSNLATVIASRCGLDANDVSRILEKAGY